MLAWIGPADAAALARFDKDLYWVRGRLREDGEPLAQTLGGIFLNAVWASPAQTFRYEPLGSGTGEPNQVFFLKHKPVFDRETIQGRELDAPRAGVGLPVIRRGLHPAALR